MKIALLHYSAPPVVGGVEKVLAHHAGLMADDGHDVCILAGRGSSVDPRISFIHIPLLDSRHPAVLAAKAELDCGRIPEQFAGLIDQIFAALKRHLQGYDILIAHNVCSLNKNLALTVALERMTHLSGAPRLILWHHDLAWTTPRYQGELHPGYPWNLLRTEWPGVRQVVVSEFRCRELAGLQGITPECIAVVPNGLEFTSFFKLEPTTITFVNELHLLDAHPLLLLPVRITPRKNIETALRVLAFLRKCSPQAQLVVTGPLGPHNPANQAYYNKLIGLRHELALESSAHFLAELSADYLPDEVIADFYRLADALLFPSQEEGFGIPILEAGISYLPVFCSDIPPLRDLGGDFATYFSLQASPETMADTISSALAALRSYQLRYRVRKHYSWEGIYHRMISPLLKVRNENQV